MLQVDQHPAGWGARLITTEPYTNGQLVQRLAGTVVRLEPTVHSIQVGPDMHLDGLGDLGYLNHSCRPSVIVDTASLTIRAAREIAAGEELTFFYPSTEWDLIHPFACFCGAPECIGTVAGAKHLPEEVLTRYFINDFIWRMVRERRG